MFVGSYSVAFAVKSEENKIFKLLEQDRCKCGGKWLPKWAGARAPRRALR